MSALEVLDDYSSPAPMKIFSRSTISGPEGLETIKALSQQGLLVSPKLEGRKAVT